MSRALLRGTARGRPPEKIEAMLGAMPGPSAVPLMHKIAGFDAEATERKEHSPHRYRGRCLGAFGTAASTPHHGREDASARAEILKMALEVISQLHDGLP